VTSQISAIGMTNSTQFLLSILRLWAVGLALASHAHAQSASQTSPTFYIREYRVEGAKKLPRVEVERAVYSFLGPERGVDDVEQARAALEKAYHAQGYQTVSVGVPQQDPRRGIIRLQVVEGKVGRLRVKGANFFLPSQIKREAPSLAEGRVPNLKQVGKEIVALNRLTDRRVTPSLLPGAEPGTVDIDLTVEDKLPLHGSLELNNRFSTGTTELRLNGGLSYANFFQKGHTGGFSFQIAPEKLADALVYSAYYLARISDGTSLMLTGTKQDSDVSTLGGASVGGRGNIIGLRAIYDLPNTEKFFQNFSIGIDYKSFEEDIVLGADTISSPIEYYPISANYGATWVADKAFTEMNHSLTFGLRGLGSGITDYSNKRVKADGNFVYLRSDVAHTRDLKDGAQLFGKLQGQLSNRPLINNDQFAGGGLGSARGYLEATSLGDNAIFGTFEYRSQSFIGNPGPTNPKSDEWRIHAFADAGWMGIWNSLPDQDAHYGFASTGLGTRFRVRDHYNGSVDIAVPLVDRPDASAGDIRITFRGWADF